MITHLFVSLLLAAPQADAIEAQATDVAAEPAQASSTSTQPVPAGEPGGKGLAILTAKALTVPLEGPQYVDNAVVLVKDGLIEAVGSRSGKPSVPVVVEDCGITVNDASTIDVHEALIGS